MENSMLFQKGIGKRCIYYIFDQGKKLVISLEFKLDNDVVQTKSDSPTLTNKTVRLLTITSSMRNLL